jgi:transaldolase
MQIFIDSADLEEIKKASEWGIIDGATTNPSLIAKTGGDFKDTVKAITELVDGPISAEVLATDAEGMIKEGKELAKIHKNINIKIPMTGEGLKAVKELSSKGIKTNVTLIFSANQALVAAKAGATFVSPFVGRLDDIGNDGMQVIADIMDVFDNYGLETQVISASIRHPMHVLDSALVGAHIATVPFGVLQKMLKHPLTDKGIAAFAADAEKSGQKI